MNVSLGERWEHFVASAVEQGRYGSASEVVREGLRLVEEREAKLLSLRQSLDTAILRGGRHDETEVDDAVKAKLDLLGLDPTEG